jgi:hypothetical protein
LDHNMLFLRILLKNKWLLPHILHCTFISKLMG